jgi:hypothetical protein
LLNPDGAVVETGIIKVPAERMLFFLPILTMVLQNNR